jgi:hypothetical protein
MTEFGPESSYILRLFNNKQIILLTGDSNGEIPPSSEEIILSIGTFNQDGSPRLMKDFFRMLLFLAKARKIENGLSISVSLENLKSIVDSLEGK